MVRKFLYFIAFCIVIYLGGRIALQFYPEQLTRITFTPGGRFEPLPQLKPNAFNDPQMWLARPGMEGVNPAKWLPDGVAAPNGKPGVALFFVHPTSYLKKTHWNDPLNDEESHRLARVMVRGEASVFSATADIWAPRYRQATFGAFVTDQPEAREALDLAYRDVAEAFDAFVGQIPADQPIALAGHSQGSYHLKRLLAEKIKGTPLARRIVAVYAIGWLVDETTDLPAMGMPACTAPNQTRCVISYLSFADEADTAMMRGAYRRFAGSRPAAGGSPRFLCSNPLTGGISGTAPAGMNSGGLVPDLKMEKATLQPGLVGARCAEDGTLRIGPGPDLGPYVLPGGNYHVYDYLLYWSNLRADFARRAAAWRP